MNDTMRTSFQKLVFAITCALFVGFSPAHADGLIEGVKVVGVYDGDTAYFVFPNNPQEIRVRLAEIDAPEADQLHGMEAGDALKQMILGKTVSVSITTYDKYNRPIVEIYLDGSYINGMMVRNGFAWAYEQYVTHPQLFVYEDEARAAKRGLWIGKNPMEPWEFRRLRR